MTYRDDRTLNRATHTFIWLELSLRYMLEKMRVFSVRLQNEEDEQSLLIEHLLSSFALTNIEHSNLKYTCNKISRRFVQ